MWTNVYISSSSIIKISYYRRNFTPGIRCYFGLQTSIGLLMGYHHPCLCLCFGFSQITLILPFLLMTLHLSQIGLTDALTFIKILSFRKKVHCEKLFYHYHYSNASKILNLFYEFILFFSPFNSSLCEIIWR